MRKLSHFLVIAATVLLIQPIITTAGLAQKWPTRPVHFILPFGPGSGADTAARLLQDKLQQIWGQPIVIEPRPGGDGIISVGAVINAKDDHVLFLGPTSVYVVQRYLHENMAYDPETDLQPIAGIAKVQIAMAVPSSLGINTVKEFVELSRAEPSKVSYAVAPGFSEFVLDAFVRENKLQIAKVPYKDITTSPMDLGANRIQLSMQSYAAMRSYGDNGKIKFIAINDQTRSTIAPNVPSVVESGYPSLVASPVLGLLGARDLPLSLRQKIAADVVTVLKDKQVVERLGLSGQPAAPMGVEEFSAAVKQQYEHVARIASVLGMKRH